MFGDVTFAQAPFAALGGNTFVTAQDEIATALASLGIPTVIKGGLQDETVTGQDAMVNIATMLASLAETATGSHVQSVIGTMLATQAELVTAAASQINAANTLLASQAESTTASAAQSVIGTMLAALSETATAADSSNRGLLVTVFVAESATADAALAAQIAVNGTVVEAAQALSSLGVVKEANVYPTGIQLIINIGGTLIWVEIDDTQNPNWQNILNSQGVVWTQIPS